ncbi:unnamed protein product [Spodoptera exigua]|nr:unnamed protein product [Spodoptera exigua]
MEVCIVEQRLVSCKKETVASVESEQAAAGRRMVGSLPARLRDRRGEDRARTPRDDEDVASCALSNHGGSAAHDVIDMDTFTCLILFHCWRLEAKRLAAGGWRLEAGDGWLAGGAAGGSRRASAGGGGLSLQIAGGATLRLRSAHANCIFL